MNNGLFWPIPYIKNGAFLHFKLFIIQTWWHSVVLCCAKTTSLSIFTSPFHFFHGHIRFNPEKETKGIIECRLKM